MKSGGCHRMTADLFEIAYIKSFVFKAIPIKAFIRCP